MGKSGIALPGIATFPAVSEIFTDNPFACPKTSKLRPSVGPSNVILKVCQLGVPGVTGVKTQLIRRIEKSLVGLSLS